MLWPYAEPFFITAAILFPLYVTAILYARKHKKAVAVAFDGAAIALLATIPCCMGVKAIMDPYRFGTFEYPDYAAVTDHRVHTNLPYAAMSITVNQHMQHYFARFTIEQEPLEEWFDFQWKANGGTSRTQREPVAPATESDLSFCNDQLSELQWTIPPGALAYKGPRESDWGGFMLFWDPSNKTAYQLMFYW